MDGHTDRKPTSMSRITMLMHHKNAEATKIPAKFYKNLHSTLVHLDPTQILAIC